MAVVVPGAAHVGMNVAVQARVQDDALREKKEAAEVWRNVLRDVEKALETTQTSGRLVVASACY